MNIVNKVDELNNKIKSGDVFYDKKFEKYYLLTSVGVINNEKYYSLISLNRHGNYHSQNKSLLSFKDIEKEIMNNLNKKEFIHYPSDNCEFTFTIENN